MKTKQIEQARKKRFDIDDTQALWEISRQLSIMNANTAKAMAMIDNINPRKLVTVHPPRRLRRRVDAEFIVKPRRQAPRPAKPRKAP